MNKKTSIGIGIAAVVIITAIIFMVIASNNDTPIAIENKITSADKPLAALINYRAIDDTRQDDGIAILDINPDSKTFGNILQDVPVGEGVLMHHPFYNSDGSKLYNTSLMGETLYRVNLHEDTIFDVKPLDAGSCVVGEDMYFAKNLEKFYLTCMGSDNVMIFDSNTDQMIGQISASKDENPDAFVKYPHGISGNEKIDRLIFTETVAPTLDDSGTSVTVAELSTGKIISTIELLQDPDTPSAPVEVQFHPEHNIAYVSGMFDGTIWALLWNDQTKLFEPKLVDDAKTREQGMPLDISFGPHGNLYISFAVPGVVNEYSLENPEQPRLLRTIPAENGAHHVLFSPDNKYMFVQNNLLNLDGLNSGTISVVDYETGETVTTLDVFKEQGMMIESLDLLIPNTLNQKVTIQENEEST